MKEKWFLIIVICLIAYVLTKHQVSAGQITVGAMPIGTVVSFGGIRWIKIDSENTFMAIDGLPAYTPPSAKLYIVTGRTSFLAVPVNSASDTCSWSPTTYLSTPTECSTNMTPMVDGTTIYTVTVSNGKSYTYTIEAINDFRPQTLQGMTRDYCNLMTELQTITLTDSRDNKTYRVRKFADGHCWMIDNLAYGNCTASSFANSYTTGYCRNNPGSSTYGHLYNWPMALTVCPSPWNLPPNAGDGSFYNLQTAYNSLSPSTSANFWAKTTHWNGVYSGGSDNTGTLNNQASRALYWSSTQNDAYGGYSLYFNTGGSVYPQSLDNKNYGFAVRCVF